MGDDLIGRMILFDKVIFIILFNEGGMTMTLYDERDILGNMI